MYIDLIRLVSFRPAPPHVIPSKCAFLAHSLAAFYGSCLAANQLTSELANTLASFNRQQATPAWLGLAFIALPNKHSEWRLAEIKASVIEKLLA